jgi:hypothetical protein
VRPLTKKAYRTSIGGGHRTIKLADRTRVSLCAAWAWEVASPAVSSFPKRVGLWGARAAMAVLVVTAAVLISQTAAASANAPRGAYVLVGSCWVAGVGNTVTSESCDLILSNGWRYRCRRFFGGRPTARKLAAAGCRRTTSIRITPAQLRLYRLMDRRAKCITRRRVLVLPVPLPLDKRRDPAGQIIDTAHNRFVVDYYLTAEEAKRDVPRLRKGAPAANVERRGNVTIEWLKHPSARLQQITSACAFG